MISSLGHVVPAMVAVIGPPMLIILAFLLLKKLGQ